MALYGEGNEFVGSCVHSSMWVAAESHGGSDMGCALQEDGNVALYGAGNEFVGWATNTGDLQHTSCIFIITGVATRSLGRLTMAAGTNSMQASLQRSCMVLGWHAQHQVQGILMPGSTRRPSLGTPVLQPHSDAAPCPRHDDVEDHQEGGPPACCAYIPTCDALAVCAANVVWIKMLPSDTDPPLDCGVFRARISRQPSRMLLVKRILNI